MASSERDPGLDPSDQADSAEKVSNALRLMAPEVTRVGSPFYGRILELLADDARGGGPTLGLLGPRAHRLLEGYFPLRLLAAFHLLVLQGKAPALAAHFASVGGDNDPDAAWPHIRDILVEHPPEIDFMLEHHIQTNEASRSGTLIVGFLEVAARTGLPLKALEVGSSAGLNLQFDRFYYEAGGRHFGPADSEVRFIDYWRNGTLRFDAPLSVAERRGCDLEPVDLRDPHERIRLLAYVWPDQRHRFDTIRSAIDIASAHPPTIDRSPIPDWLEHQLADAPTSGLATVVFHSIVWIYLDEHDRERVRSAIEAAGERATPDAPMAWLRYEDREVNAAGPELCLRLWPDDADRNLGMGGYHHSPFTLADE